MPRINHAKAPSFSTLIPNLTGNWPAIIVTRWSNFTRTSMILWSRSATKTIAHIADIVLLRSNSTNWSFHPFWPKWMLVARVLALVLVPVLLLLQLVPIHQLLRIRAAWFVTIVWMAWQSLSQGDRWIYKVRWKECRSRRWGEYPWDSTADSDSTRPIPSFVLVHPSMSPNTHTHTHAHIYRMNVLMYRLLARMRNHPIALSRNSWHTRDISLRLAFLTVLRQMQHKRGAGGRGRGRGRGRWAPSTLSS